MRQHKSLKKYINTNIYVFDMRYLINRKNFILSSLILFLEVLENCLKKKL